MADERCAGTRTYVATDDLMTAVNAAITVGRPLLIKGEPGPGFIFTGQFEAKKHTIRILGVIYQYFFKGIFTNDYPWFGINSCFGYEFFKLLG